MKNELLIIALTLALSGCCQKALHFDASAQAKGQMIAQAASTLVKVSTTEQYTAHEQEVNALKKQLDEAYANEMKRGEKCNCVSIGMVSTLRSSTGGFYKFLDDWKHKGLMNEATVEQAKERLDTIFYALPIMESYKIKK